MPSAQYSELRAKEERSNLQEGGKNPSLIFFLQHTNSDEWWQGGCVPHEKDMFLQIKEKNPTERDAATTGKRHNARVAPTARPRPEVTKGI